MFSDAFSLTKAVLDRRKTMTRRVYKTPRNSYGGLEVENNCIITFDANGCEIVTSPKYNVGEVVAIAQNYKSVTEYLAKKSYDVAKWKDDNHITKDAAGWLNKMFVKADLMPHQIRITNVLVEHLRDITEHDILAEGIQYVSSVNKYYFERGDHERKFMFNDPYEAYAALIDKISGKGCFQSNPYVFVYEFELIK